MANWYKTAKYYGENIPVNMKNTEEIARPVFITLKDGTKKQVDGVMIVPETYGDFKGKKENKYGGWIGWSVVFKEDRGWDSKKWFINDWEAEAWVRSKYPNG